VHLYDTGYKDLWIHKWLSLYILNFLVPKTKIDKKILSNFISNASNATPDYLKRLSDANLYNADLSNANLYNAINLPISIDEAKGRGSFI
jgi:hypothetical protein